MEEKFYFPELDSLRFFAFLVVFMHHGPSLYNLAYSRIKSHGWFGVDLFLCLSAFLFVHLLRVEWKKTGTIHVWFFYMRRALRIWPVYVIFVSIILFFTWSQLPDLPQAPWRIFGLFTFTDNLFSVFLKYNPFMYLAHLWTISYEEQFYAVIPWFLRYMFRQAMKRQVLVLLGILVVGNILRAVFIALDVAHPAVWVLPITHFESILFGLAIGLGVFDLVLSRVPAWVTGLAGLVGLYLVTCLPNVTTIGWSLMVLYPLVGISVALLVYSTLHAGGKGIVIRAMRWRPLTYLGKISYGLYVFHLAGLGLASQLLSWLAFLPESRDLVFVVSLALTIAIASLSYKLIEKPFLRLKSSFTIIQSRPI